MRKTLIIIFCFLFISCEYDFQIDKKITADEFINEELKSLLLEIYNHQSNRNYATSYQIDLYSIKFNETIYKNFRINFEYNYREGEIYGRPIVKNFIFDEKFYFSNEFYGLLSVGKQNGNDYLRLLDDISENYKQARIYAQYEIEN